jgi:hypothetical protein
MPESPQGREVPPVFVAIGEVEQEVLDRGDLEALQRERKTRSNALDVLDRRFERVLPARGMRLKFDGDRRLLLSGR